MVDSNLKALSCAFYDDITELKEYLAIYDSIFELEDICLSDKVRNYNTNIY
jgi:hypothetical protein